MMSTKFLCPLLSVVFFMSTIGLSFAADGFEYLPDEATLGLWHFSVEIPPFGKIFGFSKLIVKNYERGN